jgi:hypothetical protein
MTFSIVKTSAIERVKRLPPGLLAGTILVIALWAYLPVGIYLGGDWWLPATPHQVEQFFFPYTWISGPNFGMPWLLAAIGLPYSLFVYVISWLGLPVEYLGKTILTLVIVAAYFFQYRLLRYFNLSNFASIFGGMAYVTTPVFFNYALMGWQLALLAMALFPLAAQWFCSAIRQNDMRYAVGVAFVWVLATLQSQSLVWFPLLFMALGIYLVQDRKSAKDYLKKLSVIFVSFVILCSYWWMALILFKDENVTSGAIIMSSVSLGADGNFIPQNALRLWGSLFNFQYESALSRGWALGAWLLPLAAILAVLGSKGEKRRLALAIGILAFVLPAGILFLKEHRELLVGIPGAGVIRQLSRFSVLTSFAYAVLLGIFLDLLSQVKRLPKRFILFSTVAVFTLGVWPWWMGELTNFLKTPTGRDFRLRMMEFPSDYYEVEKGFSKMSWASRALYLPYGMGMSFKGTKFHGAYNEAVEVFSALSPIPGAFVPNGRPSPISDYMAFIQHTDDIIAATRLTPTNFYVLRKNIDAGPIEKIFKQTNRYFPGDLFDRIWDSQNISIYLRKNLVPLVYSPPKSQLHGGQVNALDDMATSDLVSHGIAVVFASQNFGKEDSATRFAAASNIPDAVEFRKINPTKFRVRLHHANGDVPILLGDGYSRGWRLYPTTYPAQEKVTINTKGYAISTENKRYQAGSEEAKEFANFGWISKAGEEFISKRFFGSIQNNNLPEGSFMDTWDSLHLPEERHIKVNGYANGWLVDIDQLCVEAQICQRNADGSYDVELIMEFWPQQVFYIGLAITVSTSLLFIVFLLIPRRKIGVEAEVIP